MSSWALLNRGNADGTMCPGGFLMENLHFDFILRKQKERNIECKKKTPTRIQRKKGEKKKKNELKRQRNPDKKQGKNKRDKKNKQSKR